MVSLCGPGHTRRSQPNWRAELVFVNRAAIVALATFASALVGFGLQHLLPAAYVADSKGMIGSVVGLVALLLSLVQGDGEEFRQVLRALLI